MNTKPENVLITGGRAPVALELARSLSMAGHRVFCADTFPCFLCMSSNKIIKSFVVPSPKLDENEFVTAFLKILEEETISWLIPTCEEVFYIAKHKEALSKHCHVFVDSLDTLKGLHHKFAFIEKIQHYSLPFPRSWLIESKEQIDNIRKKECVPRMVLKPVYSRFCSRVHFLEHPSPIPSDVHPTPEAPWIFQEFIEGKHFCSFSIAEKGKLKAHVVYPVTFRVGNGASVYFENITHEPITNWITQFLSSEQFSGHIAFDFIQNEKGEVFPIECNPRATSGIHLFEDIKNFHEAYFKVGETLMTPHPNTRRLLAFPMWTYALFSINSWRELRNWFKTVALTKDVLFRWNDPYPAFYQFLEYAYFWKRSKKNQTSLVEATTSDIEWNG